MEDILIVGAGIFGVSTAYHLSTTHPSPTRITLLDRSPPPSARAASNDVNRIIRADYSNKLYTELGLEAIQAWKTLPFFQDTDVYQQSGWIAMDEKDSDVPVRIRENFRALNRDEAILDMGEEDVRSRWGGLLARTDCSPFGSYYYNPSAGWADAGRGLSIMAEEAVRRGVRYEVGEVRRILVGERGVRGVETESGDVYMADKVLLATGAWTSHLMSGVEDELGVRDEDRVERQVSAAGVCVAYFQLSEAEKELYSQLPVLVYGGQGEVIPPTNSGELKFTIATSFKNTVKMPSGHDISIPAAQSVDIPQELKDDCISSVKKRLPQLLDGGRLPDRYRIFWDAISPAQQPLITRHPDPRLSNLYFSVGGSFHCYKFLPIIGKYVVNVLSGVGNGREKDEAWAWKPTEGRERGVHESLVPKRELRSFA